MHTPNQPPDPTRGVGADVPGGAALHAEPDIPKGPNLFVRIGQVFFSPGELFNALKARPVWIDVMIVLVVLSVASQMLIPEARFREIFMTQLPPGTELEDAERIMEFTRKFGTAVAAISLFLASLVIAGLIILQYNVILGGEARFKQLFSAVTHSLLILTAGGFLTLALILAGGDQVVLSPALLLPDLGDGFLARVAYRINIFAIWTSVVLGIAVSKMYPKRSAFGGTMFLLVWYTILISLSSIPGG
ncbi:MAG: YIP1 family protein [Gemmatimonadota bacterium]